MKIFYIFIITAKIFFLILSLKCDKQVSRLNSVFPCKWDESLDSCNLLLQNNQNNLNITFNTAVSENNCRVYSTEECKEDSECEWDEIYQICLNGDRKINQNMLNENEIFLSLISINCTKIPKEKCNQTPGCYWDNLHYNCYINDDFNYQKDGDCEIKPNLSLLKTLNFLEE